MKSFFAAAPLIAAATLSLAKPILNHHKRQSQRDPSLDISNSLQNILDNTHGSDLYAYPTDLTRGILPVRMSSPDPSSSLTCRVETNPLAQRLLARHPLLHCPLSWLCLDRSGCLALQ